MTKNHTTTPPSPSSVGLVLEGGGLRGMFTNGILDVFMKNDIKFDAAVGVSAGVLFGCNYKSNQPGRALRYNIKYKDNPKQCLDHACPHRTIQPQVAFHP